MSETVLGESPEWEYWWYLDAPWRDCGFWTGPYFEWWSAVNDAMFSGYYGA